MMPAASPMTEVLKLCRPCSTWKMHSEFAKDSRIKSGLMAKCKPCNRNKSAKYRDDNPGKNALAVAAWRELNPTYVRDYYEANIEKIRKAGISGNRRRKYGLTDEDYLALWHSQEGKCYLCKEPETAKYVDGRVKMLAVDHDHKTGAVRKLLCQRCNTALGNFKEDPKLLQAAIDYLKEH